VEAEEEPEQRSNGGGAGAAVGKQGADRTEGHRRARGWPNGSDVKRGAPLGVAGRGWPHGIAPCIRVEANPGGGSISLLEPSAPAAIAFALTDENPRQG
jgi:hypothetical protein